MNANLALTQDFKLTKEECNNIKVSILSLAKAPNTSENEMILLLNLAHKFNWVEPIEKPIKPDADIPTAKKEVTNGSK